MTRDEIAEHIFIHAVTHMRDNPYDTRADLHQRVRNTARGALSFADLFEEERAARVVRGPETDREES